MILSFHDAPPDWLTVEFDAHNEMDLRSSLLFRHHTSRTGRTCPMPLDVPRTDPGGV